jgi:hypothetical protein
MWQGVVLPTPLLMLRRQSKRPKLPA